MSKEQHVSTYSEPITGSTIASYKSSI